MFCLNCGTKIEEGSRFCMGCGTPIAAQQQTAMPSPAPQYIPAQPTQYTPPPAGAFGGVTPVHKKNKLLLIAIIVAGAICLIFEIAAILNNFVINHAKDFDNAMEAILMPILFLFLLAVPALLTVIGEIKNKKILILVSGIIYFFTFLGIPSAILCFIAFAKMKKT